LGAELESGSGAAPTYCELGTEHSGFKKKSEKFVHQLRDYQLFKKDYIP
jgi:hypothetical protein